MLENLSCDYVDGWKRQEQVGRVAKDSGGKPAFLTMRPFDLFGRSDLESLSIQDQRLRWNQLGVRKVGLPPPIRS